MVERFLEQQPAIAAALLSPELLQATQESLGDTQFVKDIKEAIHQDLKKRYAGDLEKTKLKIASALDARFKSLPFLSDDDRRETYRRVVDEASAIAEQHPQEGVVRLEQEELSEDETAEEEEAPQGGLGGVRWCYAEQFLGVCNKWAPGLEAHALWCLRGGLVEEVGFTRLCLSSEASVAALSSDLRWSDTGEDR
ncbi:hypothetical protein AAFF_G00392150 [Aldrovandia affinis]|uniref:Uncharacterized protein n=1 Tax=Aldrovandia affinis TaxID=143900 RepID=A0AAD7SE41_9TELE|nr:hypothetical protein AAFF_G00392150 [Aldrovandia affinis]